MQQPVRFHVCVELSLSPETVKLLQRIFPPTATAAELRKVTAGVKRKTSKLKAAIEAATPKP